MLPLFSNSLLIEQVKMGGGLIQLVSFGAQSMPLMGNPQFSFFKQVFKRHTNFATEMITVPFDSYGTVIGLAQGLTVSLKIPRNADLVKDIFLAVTLPDIYSDDTTRFQWIENVGQYIIETASITVGGQLISRITGEWLHIWSELSLPADKRGLYDRMTGNVSDFSAPQSLKKLIVVRNNEIYNSTYPTATPTQPSIPGHTLYIPLPFWFSKHPGLALPLVALMYHEVELQIQFRPFNTLYQLWNNDVGRFLSPKNFDSTPNSALPLLLNAPVSYGQIGRYLSFQALASSDPVLQPLFYPANQVGATQTNVMKNNLDVQITTLQSLSSSQIGVDIKGNMEINYVYLDDEERRLMSESGATYLIEYIYTQEFTGLGGNALLDLHLANPIKELVWLTRRSDNALNNDWTNFTNVQPALNSVYRSTESTILKTAKIMFNGLDRTASKPASYFNQLEPYMNHTASGRDGLYSYSFGIFPEQVQPSGSVNTSRITKFQMQIECQEPLSSSYSYNLNMYAVSQNMFKIFGGMGGLVYAL